MMYPSVFRDTSCFNEDGSENFYKWMEDASENLGDNPELKTWIDAQNSLFSSTFDEKERDSLLNKMLDRFKYTKYGLPSIKGNQIFQLILPVGLDHHQLTVRANMEDDPNVLVDPNQWSTDGSKAMMSHSVSENGKFVACLVSRNGSDWGRIRVVNVGNGQFLDEQVDFVKYTVIEWFGDEGFFYCKPKKLPAAWKGKSYDDIDLGTEKDPMTSHQVFFHRVGTPVNTDTMICGAQKHSDKEKYWLLEVEVSDDKKMDHDVWIDEHGEKKHVRID